MRNDPDPKIRKLGGERIVLARHNLAEAKRRTIEKYASSIHFFIFIIYYLILLRNEAFNRIEFRYLIVIFVPRAESG